MVTMTAATCNRESRRLGSTTGYVFAPSVSVRLFMSSPRPQSGRSRRGDRGLRALYVPPGSSTRRHLGRAHRARSWTPSRSAATRGTAPPSRRPAGSSCGSSRRPRPRRSSRPARRRATSARRASSSAVASPRRLAAAVANASSSPLHGIPTSPRPRATAPRSTSASSRWLLQLSMLAWAAVQ